MKHISILFLIIAIALTALSGCDSQDSIVKPTTSQTDDPSRIGYGDNRSGNEVDEIPNWTQFLADVLAAPIEDRPAMVDSFLTLVEDEEDYGFPLTVEEQCVYLYTGTVNSVGVPGDHNGWNPDADQMTVIPGTLLWYHETSYELDARLDYKFVTNGGTWILDPRNPRQINGGFGPNSEMAMPEYVNPWRLYTTGISCMAIWRPSNSPATR